jgi:hypothetical protein
MRREVGADCYGRCAGVVTGHVESLRACEWGYFVGAYLVGVGGFADDQRGRKLMGCTEKCWEPKDCPTHHQPMHPFGRSAPLGFYDCCENYGKSNINRRHLWDEHDSDRSFTDPAGWILHALGCDREECDVDWKEVRIRAEAWNEGALAIYQSKDPQNPYLLFEEEGNGN